MVSVKVQTDVADIVDPKLICRIISVSSSEPQQGMGRGDKAPDWLIKQDLNVYLKSERFGNGSGRVYSIMVECTDKSGNIARSTVDVKVPHNKGVKKENEKEKEKKKKEKKRAKK